MENDQGREGSAAPADIQGDEPKTRECFMCGCPSGLRQVNKQADVFACREARGCLDRQAAIDKARGKPQHASKVEIDRAELHAELDRFLDSVAAEPLDITDGEMHKFVLRGGVTAHHEGQALTQFTVTTSRTKLV